MLSVLTAITWGGGVKQNKDTNFIKTLKLNNQLGHCSLIGLYGFNFNKSLNIIIYYN